MSSISNSLGTQVQMDPKLVKAGSTATADPMNTGVAGQTSNAQGDTVTISKEGQALAKNSGGGISSESANTAKLKELSVSKSVLTENLREAQITQKSLKSKIEAAKLQEQSNPNSAGDVAKLNSRLNDINSTVTKDRLKANG